MSTCSLCSHFSFFPQFLARCGPPQLQQGSGRGGGQVFVLGLHMCRHSVCLPVCPDLDPVANLTHSVSISMPLCRLTPASPCLNTPSVDVIIRFISIAAAGAVSPCPALARPAVPGIRPIFISLICISLLSFTSARRYPQSRWFIL